MIDPQRGLILWWSLSTIILLLLTPRCSAALFRPGSAVKMLSAADFKSKVKNGDEPWIVNFGADWCGPCKNFAPQYEQAAGMLRGQFNFGAIDCTSTNPAATAEGVNSYPTIKIYKGKGAPGQDYRSGRDANSVVNYLKPLIQQRPQPPPPRPQPIPLAPQPQPRPQPPQPRPQPPAPQPRPQPRPQPPRPQPRPQPPRPRPPRREEKPEEEEEEEEEETPEEEEEDEKKPKRRKDKKKNQKKKKPKRKGPEEEEREEEEAEEEKPRRKKKKGTPKRSEKEVTTPPVVDETVTQPVDEIVTQPVDNVQPLPPTQPDKSSGGRSSHALLIDGLLILMLMIMTV